MNRKRTGGEKNDEMREEEGRGGKKSDERTGDDELSEDSVEKNPGGTEFDRHREREREWWNERGGGGSGIVSVQGERREKGTIKISAIQSLAGNSRAWHLYY